MINVGSGAGRAGLSDLAFSRLVKLAQDTVVSWKVKRQVGNSAPKQPEPELTERLQALGLKPERLWWGPMTLFPWKAEILLDELETNPPQHVLEVGSGTSTAIFAALAEKYDFRFTSLENHQGTIAYVEEMLEGLPCASRVNIQLCNFVKRRYEDGKKYRWYDAKLEDLPPIDCAMVDGPMGTFVGRNGALPSMKPYLSKDYRLFLDDATRPHEIACIEEWKHYYPAVRTQTFKNYKGFVCISEPGTDQ